MSEFRELPGFQPNEEKPKREDGWGFAVGLPENEERLFSLEGYERNESLVSQLQVFIEEFDPHADIVYVVNPSGDISGKVAFGESRVIIAENDPDYKFAYPLTEVEFHEDDPRTFDPGEVDIAVMCNSILSPDTPAKQVRAGGYFLCNNYFKTADTVYAEKGYVLKGVLCDRGVGLTCETEELHSYMDEVETEEQLREAGYLFGNTITFDDLKELVTKYRIQNGEIESDEDMVTTYKRMMDRAFTEDVKSVKLHPSEDTQLLGIEALMAQDGILQFTFADGETVHLFPLPKQKGDPDDVFVFQKKQKEQVSQD